MKWLERVANLLKTSEDSWKLEMARHEITGNSCTWLKRFKFHLKCKKKNQKWQKMAENY